MVRRFPPQGLSNLLWGLSHFRACDQELLSLLAREAVYKVDDLKPLSITTILDAWANAGWVDFVGTSTAHARARVSRADILSMGAITTTV